MMADLNTHTHNTPRKNTSDLYIQVKKNANRRIKYSVKKSNDGRPKHTKNKVNGNA